MNGKQVTFNKLKWYQEELIKEIFDYFSNFSGRLLVSAPTGSGKTYVGLIALAKMKTKNKYFLTYRSACKVQVDEKRLEIIHKTTDPVIKKGLNEIQVMNIQTFISQNFKVNNNSAVCIDEAHHIREDGAFKDCLDKLSQIKFIFGLTGSPRVSFRADGFDFIVGVKREQTSFNFPQPIRELISFPKLKLDLSERLGFSESHFKYQEHSWEIVKTLKSGIAYKTDKQYCEFVAHEVEDKIKKHKLNNALIFMDKIDHINTVANILNSESDHYALTICSENTDEQLKMAFNSFRANDSSSTKVLLGINSLSEGVDLPNAESIFLFINTTSDIRYSQIIGRLLRECENKPEVYIFDYGYNFETYHHEISKEDYLYNGSMSGDQVDYYHLESQSQKNFKVKYVVANIDYIKLGALLSELTGLDDSFNIEKIKFNDIEQYSFSPGQVKSFLMNIPQMMHMLDHCYSERNAKYYTEDLLKSLENLQTINGDPTAINKEVHLVKYLMEPLMNTLFGEQNVQREKVTNTGKRIDLLACTNSRNYIFEFSINEADNKISQIREYARELDQVGYKNIIKIVVGTSFNKTSSYKKIEENFHFINWLHLTYFLIKKINIMIVNNSNSKSEDTFDIFNELENISRKAA